MSYLLPVPPAMSAVLCNCWLDEWGPYIGAGQITARTMGEGGPVPIPAEAVEEAQCLVCGACQSGGGGWGIRRGPAGNGFRMIEGVMLPKDGVNWVMLTVWVCWTNFHAPLRLDLESESVARVYVLNCGTTLL